VVVGSGPNGLAAAVTLAAHGKKVTLLEAAEDIGGGVRSAELTEPGLIHDECAALHPFTARSPFYREHDLARHGLTWLTADAQYAHPLEGGRGATAYRSLDRTAISLGSDARSWRRAFGGVEGSFAAVLDEVLQPVAHLPRRPLALARYGARAVLPAALLGRSWRTDEARGLFAGVAAHAIRPFHTPLSSAIGLLLGAAAHADGWQVAQGGSGRIAVALAARLRELGGEIMTGYRVTSLSELLPAETVMLDLMPKQVAKIAGDYLPTRIRRAYEGYRHGPAAFKLDLAVEDAIPWSYAEASRAGTVHVGGTFEEIAAAEAEIAYGRMPERPFVLVTQQAIIDPSRAGGGRQPISAYAHVPPGYTGDATEAILSQMERFAPGVRDRVVAMTVRSPAVLAAHNSNYVGGDIVGGSNEPRQMLFRPRLTPDPYATGISGVYICSAATPPGAGAHGICGYLAAKRALAR